MVKLIQVAGCIAMMMGSAWCAEAQLTNPGFETGPQGQFVNGSTTLVPGWTLFGANGWHHNDAGNIHSGSLAVKNWNFDTGLWQGFSASAGQAFDVGVFALTPANDVLSNMDGVLKVEWYNGGTQLSVSEVGKFFSGVDPTGVWKSVSGTVTAPAGTDNAKVVIGLSPKGGPIGGSLNWDDASVSIAAIPEPSTVALMGLGLAAVLGGVYRRKSFA